MREPLFVVALLAASCVGAQSVPADLQLTSVCPTCDLMGTVLIVRHAGDGSNRLFIGNQAGRIRVYTGGSNYESGSFLDFSSATGTAPPDGLTFPGTFGESGLLGLAFHPSFATNRMLFVNYTNGNGDTVVARYQTQVGNPNVVDTSSRTVILRVDQDFANHNGGNLLFGPDGFLYIGMGDGGSGNDPCNRAQSLTPSDVATNEPNNAACVVDANFVSGGGNADSRALLGKILRINVDTTTPASASNELCGDNADGSANYAIPAGNPFAGASGVAGACDEILDYGIRNPWRFSFDRVLGDLWIGDVGQSTREEISLRRRGDVGAINFGWDCREGFTVPQNNVGVCRPGDSLRDPVADYNRNAGQSVTGGYRYRGLIRQMDGVYLFADYLTSRVWAITETSPGVFGPAPTNANQVLIAPALVATFGEDEAGDLYVGGGNNNGRFYRFTSATAGLPQVVLANGFE